jgi:hypothetical protein
LLAPSRSNCLPLRRNSARLRLKPGAPWSFQIIEHRSTLSVEEMVAIIGTVMTDPDPVMREAALSAIVSRTSIRDTSIDQNVQNGQQQSAALMKGLRAQVEDALVDPAERVRLRAIGALVATDDSRLRTAALR